MQKRRGSILVLVLALLINASSPMAIRADQNEQRIDKSVFGIEKVLTSSINTCSIYADKVLAGTIVTGMYIATEAKLYDGLHLIQVLREFNSEITIVEEKDERDETIRPSQCY